jgi:chromosome condensin MukBEF complex kleisin-like MukF subunit
VIVRLMGEGQWRVDDSLAERLQELDAATEHAVQAGDEAALQSALRELADTVRSNGVKLGDDHLGRSDAVVPPIDLTLDEAREILHGEGLIPDIL